MGHQQRSLLLFEKFKIKNDHDLHKIQVIHNQRGTYPFIQSNIVESYDFG